MALNFTFPVLRRALLAGAAAAFGLALGAGAAHADYSDPVDLQVVDRDTGQVLPVWRHDGRLFVAGRPGARYGLRVTNHTGERVLVVMSVDGVNILTGETAGYDQRGYIFSPYESYDVNGWRKSTSQIAAFTFARLSQSYAARTGRPGDVGVIGIAVFDEKTYDQPIPEAEAPAAPLYREPSTEDARGGIGRGAPSFAAPPPMALAPRAAPAPSSQSAPADKGYAGSITAERRDERLGTGHGQREWSSITIQPFERASSTPEFTARIEYDTYEHLAAAGVIPTWRYGESRPPRPFPSSPDGGFVPDP